MEAIRVGYAFCGSFCTYDRAMAALEQVQPKDLGPTEINVRLGATWVPAEIVEQFAKELFQTPGYLERYIHVRFEPYTSVWQVDGKQAQRGVQVQSTYGTEDVGAWAILEQTLNLKDVSVYDYILEGGKKKAKLNVKKTTLARDKQALIKQKFVDWIWADPDRREQLCALYNERFNCIRPREYDGSFLELPGLNPEITLRPHQRNAIARILLGGNTLLAHAVGAGKTFTMTAAAMEMKRVGLCHKSLFVVPNGLTEQWGAEYMRLYPAANILVATRHDFETRYRRAFCARIATGDYDAVIIAQSQFEKIPISQERQRLLLEQEMEAILHIIESARRDAGGRLTVKQMERAKRNIQA